MPQPDSVAGPNDAETFPAVCGYTHLFPGARCRLQGLADPLAFVAGPWPIAVDLHFSDGMVADAVLTTDDPPGASLRVPAYTTGAGNRMSESVWRIREFSGAGDEVELRLGQRATA
ncbi:hypothetical protein ACFYVL_34660 [Streptomyces sp. NPDC004111]|uniref:hypothetical protein n=1 Tax=Streptomyces sp. NPDC004111 TaxID=3364690 RepID=UPI0036891E5F